MAKQEPKAEPKPSEIDTHDGKTASEWAKEAQEANARTQELEKLINVMSAEEEEHRRLCPVELMRVLRFKEKLSKTTLVLGDQEALKQAETVVVGLQSWLQGVQADMAKILADRYPAVEIIGDKVTFGNGIHAPKGMVYARETHPAQFEQIVAQRLANVDFIFKTVAK